MSYAQQTVSARTLTHPEQVRMVEDIRVIVGSSPLVRPRTPSGLDMRVKVTAAGKLGWVGDGAYRYSETDSAGKPWPAMPEWWRVAADHVVARASGGFAWLGFIRPFAWDCAIINWYTPGASLGWHQDKSEAEGHWPIVTFSLGDACSWAVKPHHDDKPTRTRLVSGAIVVLEGPTRRWLHSVERIHRRSAVEDQVSLFGGSAGAAVLGRPGRVSVTLRVAGVT